MNVKTAAGGTYNPFVGNPLVTFYASGIRNAYDLVWHTNGKLYVPTNGSAAGGNTPATPATLPPECAERIDLFPNGPYTGPAVPSLTKVKLAQPDYLYKVEKDGYHGAPNPTRCEWALNGGNPTSGTDYAEITDYPVGVQPDRNYKGFNHNLGDHASANGAIEYRSGTFGGTLRGTLMVVRYSVGKDIRVLTLNPAGDVTGSLALNVGTATFTSPLDLTEDPSNGNLYVADHGKDQDLLGVIHLLRPKP